MSYVAKKGRAAADSAMQEGGGKDYSDTLFSFKCGTELKVRIPSAEDFVEYPSHGVYKVFYSCPCTKLTGETDLYDKAVDLLYKDAADAKKAGNETLEKELKDKAYQLKAKPRYLFGFYNLADGEPILIDVSKKQAQVLIATIDKFAKKLGKVAFELAKTGSSTSTSVSLMPMLDMDDLSGSERKNFEATADKPFPEDSFGKVFKFRGTDGQIDDLKAFGFDVSRLGVAGDTVAKEEFKPISDEISDEDLPF